MMDEIALSDQERQRDEALTEEIRKDVRSGRLSQLVLTPPMEWGQGDVHLIKAVLCMVASKMIRGQL